MSGSQPMKVYLDICRLKRPFDDQSQPRIAVESTAVIAILGFSERGLVELLRSSAHYIENAADPDMERRSAVDAWLRLGQVPPAESESVMARFEALRGTGMGQMDALHLAWAEELGADALLTTDDRFVSRAERLGHKLRISNPVLFVQEARL